MQHKVRIPDRRRIVVHVIAHHHFSCRGSGRCGARRGPGLPNGYRSRSAAGMLRRPRGRTSGKPLRAGIGGKSVRPAYSAPGVRMTTAQSVRADSSGRVTEITPLRHGLFRVHLDDGRMFDTTTNTAAPPAVGDDVSLRRTVVGTTFLDIRGRSPISVRLGRD